MQIIDICLVLFEICLMKKKKKKKNKIEIFAFDFLDYEEKSWNSGAIFDIRIAKGFIYKSFASLHCVYFGATPIP